MIQTQIRKLVQQQKLAVANEYSEGDEEKDKGKLVAEYLPPPSPKTFPV